MPDNSPANKYATFDLFSFRDSTEEAMAYASSIIETLPEDKRAAVYTALYVVSNTGLRLMSQLDITQIQPRALNARPDGFCLQDLSPAEAQLIVRELLPKMVTISFLANRMDLPFEADIGMFTGAVSVAYGVDPKFLADEVEAMHQRLLNSRD